jgi:hypothetical protein
MKINKILTTAAIAVIVISSFLAVSCELFGTINSVVVGNTNVKFRNQTPPANRSAVNGARASVQMGGTTVDTASFNALNGYYTGLTSSAGGLQTAKFTPSKFELQNGGIIVALDRVIPDVGTNVVPLSWGSNMIIDFVQGTTLTTTRNVPKGITAESICIDLAYGDAYFGDITLEELEKAIIIQPETTFTIPEALHASHPWRSFKAQRGTIISEAAFDSDPDSYPGWKQYTNTGTTITVPTMLLLPQYYHAFSETWQVFTMAIYYYGTVYRYVDYDHGGAVTGGIDGNKGVVIPSAGISVPATMSSITFNVNFDVTDLIEQYGTNEKAVYVLANGFWFHYSLTAHID